MNSNMDLAADISKMQKLEEIRNIVNYVSYKYDVDEIDILIGGLTAIRQSKYNNQQIASRSCNA